MATTSASHCSSSSRTRGAREAIHTLSLILSAVDLPRLPSEVFRQAKLDSEAARQPMLCLLYHTCLLLNKLPAVGHTPSHPTHEYDEHQQQWVELSVMKYLYKQGYRNVHFFNERTRSRPLLLAFGWLMHKCRLIKWLTEYHLYQMNHPSLPHQMCSDTLVDQLVCDIQAWTNELTSATGHSDLLTRVQKLIWLNGRFKRDHSTIMQAVPACQSLSHSLSPPLTATNTAPQSLYEALLLCYPEHLESYCSQLTHHLGALQAIEEWSSQAHVFWQWMESVYDLEHSSVTECGDTSSSSNSKETMSNGDLQHLVSEVTHLEKRVQSLASNAQPHIDKLNKVLGSLTLRTSEQIAQNCYSQLAQDPVFAFLNGLRQVPTTKTSSYRTYLLSLHPRDYPMVMLTLDNKLSKQTRRESSKKVATIAQQQVTATIDQTRTAVRLQLASLVQQLPDSICTVNNKL